MDEDDQDFAASGFAVAAKISASSTQRDSYRPVGGRDPEEAQWPAASRACMRSTNTRTTSSRASPSRPLIRPAAVLAITIAENTGQAWGREQRR